MDGGGGQLMTPLSETEYGALRDDIRERGRIMVPVIVDEDGNVLDGIHRRRAAAELRAEGLAVEEPAPTVVKGLSEAERLLLGVRVNIARRQLTDYQRLAIARRLEGAVREVTLERRQAGLRNVGKSRSAHMCGTRPVPGDTIVPAGTDARDAVAELTGIGRGMTFERQRRIVEGLEQLAEHGVDQAKEALELAGKGEVGLSYLRRTHERLRTAMLPGATGTFVEAAPDPAPMPAPTDRAVADRWCHVVLTREEYHDLRPHALRRPDWRPVESALVTLTVAESVVRAMSRELPARLRAPFAAALDPDKVKAIEDLSSEEQVVVQRIRRQVRAGGTHVVEVEVRAGRVRVRATKSWAWYRERVHA